MKGKKFLRRDSIRFSKLGKNRPKKQVWRAAKGRDNKIRLHRKGYPKAPSVGYMSPRKNVNKIEGKYPILVNNARELKSLTENNVAILARIGAKKKLELIKMAQELKIKIINLPGDVNK